MRRIINLTLKPNYRPHWQLAVNALCTVGDYGKGQETRNTSFVKYDESTGIVTLE